VRFTVAGVNLRGPTAVTTNASGQAQFCYTGTVAGNDTISAFADTNTNGSDDGASEPDDTAAKTYQPAAPATLELAPASATNTVDEQHCVTATLEDSYGNRTPGISVPFTVTGSNDRGPDAVITNASGQAQFCYTGTIAGSDTISAFADTNGNGSDGGAGEPDDTATKTWDLPPGNDCDVNFVGPDNDPGTPGSAGTIIADNGDSARFDGRSRQGTSPSGDATYQDRGPAEPMTVVSINIDRVRCSANLTSASVFGRATINGGGSHQFRIDVQDLGNPGRLIDTYRIQLDTSYDSGQQVLRSGNVQIH
jgi:hypothetical protein